MGEVGSVMAECELLSNRKIVHKIVFCYEHAEWNDTDEAILQPRMERSVRDEDDSRSISINIIIVVVALQIESDERT